MKKFLNVLITAMVFLSVGCMPVKANENGGIITAYTNILKSSQYQDDGEHECRYIIYDIDKNDIPELIVDIGKSEAERKIYFYTYDNGQAICIGDRGSSHSHFASIPDKNGIMIITAHSSRQYAGIISVTNGAINEEELFYKYLTPEEYIAHNDGYYEPDELYSGSVELNFIDKNDLSGLKNYNYASSNTDSSSIGNDISVEINNKKIQFDVPPQIINDRTMVPMRAIFEELGYAVDWNQSTKSITATKGNNKIFMTIDNKNMYYNDTVKELDAVPTIINDRTLVPVRAISEASGYDVQWDSNIRKVIISTPQQEKNATDTTEGNVEFVTGTSSFYNALSDVEKVREYINSGLYLEAINLCDFVTENYNLSDDDKNMFSLLKQEAQTNYDEYISEQSKWKEYYYDDWCIGFTGLASYKPTYFKGGDHIQVYNLGGSTINITSYKIGTIGSSGKLTSNINECAKMFQTIIDYSTDSIEIISETDTTAGTFNAYQRTYRITEYINRYQTKADYKIIRHIVFKYGDWIYLIDAEQNKYIWDDDFYQLLEKVRTSILFR